MTIALEITQPEKGQNAFISLVMASYDSNDAKLLKYKKIMIKVTRETN